MKIRTLFSLAGFGLLIPLFGSQSTTFDFDSAPRYTPFPITLTVEGITVTFSGTGSSYSIQAANTLGFTPAGFGGNCIYPSSVFGADLLITFTNATVTDFSIMYAPEEYACDSSARMRATGYMNGTFVATNTTSTYAGTWPTGTLPLHAVSGFNYVVVHYDAPPPTGGDWGPIFLADNMVVTTTANPARLTGTFDLPNYSGSPAGLTATVEFRIPGTTNVAFSYPVLLNDQGGYDAGVVEPGTWDVAVKLTHWLRDVAPSVAIAAGGNTVNFAPVDGDVTGDNVVDLFDINSILVQFGQYDPQADLDGSTLVDLFDLNLVLLNFGMVGAN